MLTFSCPKIRGDWSIPSSRGDQWHSNDGCTEPLLCGVMTRTVLWSLQLGEKNVEGCDRVTWCWLLIHTWEYEFDQFLHNHTDISVLLTWWADAICRSPGSTIAFWVLCLLPLDEEFTFAICTDCSYLEWFFHSTTNNPSILVLHSSYWPYFHARRIAIQSIYEGKTKTRREVWSALRSNTTTQRDKPKRGRRQGHNRGNRNLTSSSTTCPLRRVFLLLNLPTWQTKNSWVSREWKRSPMSWRQTALLRDCI